MKNKAAEPVAGMWVKVPYLPTETEIWEGTRRIAKVSAGIIGLSEVETAYLLATVTDLLALAKEVEKGPSICTGRKCGECTVCKARTIVKKAEGPRS